MFYVLCFPHAELVNITFPSRLKGQRNANDDNCTKSEWWLPVGSFESEPDALKTNVSVLMTPLQSVRLSANESSSSLERETYISNRQ